MYYSISEWVLGMLSNIVWLFVFIPQIITNIKLHSSKAISYYLILCWLVGDFLSVMSANALNLSKIIIVNGIFHIIFDCIFCIQWIYYEINSEERIYLINNERNGNERMIFKLSETRHTIIISIILLICKILIYKDFYGTTIYIANIFGWIATIAFLSSRIPQIILNHKRRSIEGLSFITFISIFIANNLFLASLFARMIDFNENILEFLLKNLQWISGVFISDIFDLIILGQFYRFRV